MILKYNEEDQNKEFYAEMGKFFADRGIIKELDCQLYNDKNTTWYISVNENYQEIDGFISIQDKGKYNYIDNFYVVSKYRNKGIGNKLLKEVIKDYDNIKLISRNEAAIHLFRKFGFEEYGQNGRYKKFQIVNNR